MTRVQSALTQPPYALPIAVGLNPNEVAIGASGVVSLNDRSGISANAGGGAVVALGSTGTTSVGSSAAAHAIWSRPNLLIRGARLDFYKTQGVASIQAGTTFTDPDENRTLVPIRQDPIWVVQLSGPDTGTPITVNNQNPSVSLPPGNYGATIVNSGYTLILNDGGSYGFTSLDLEPGAIVQIAFPEATTISVTAGLILRSRLGNTSRLGLIFVYLGSSTAHVESPFAGDLFLAPNADIELKASSTGHFFGKNFTTFEGASLAAPALSNRSLDFVRPTERPGANNGQFDTRSTLNSGFTGEISSAIMTPAVNPSCPAASTAFMSVRGYQLISRSLDTIGQSPLQSATGQDQFPDSMPSPATCLGKLFPDPAYPPVPWQILPGGTPFYRDLATPNDRWDQTAAFDAIVTRLDNGRVVDVGFTERHCEDPNVGLLSGPGCPPHEPANGSACDPANETGACIYGPTQCTCCKKSGATCSADRECCTGCDPKTHTCFPGAPNAFFQCGKLVREEARVLGVRMSNQCGADWTSGVLDQTMFLGNTWIDRDRPEAYFDPFDRKLYVSEFTRTSSTTQNTIFAASTDNVTDPTRFNWFVVNNKTDNVAAPEVMTTVLDEQALLQNGVHGRWVHLVTFRCAGTSPVLVIETPLGRRTIDFSFSGVHCENVPLGTPPDFALFRNQHAGPSIVGISSSPPQIHVAYGARGTNGHQIIVVWRIPLRSTQNYDTGAIRAGAVVEYTVDRTAFQQDALWPQLIRPDGQAGSDLHVDTPILLRYGLLSLTGATTPGVREQAVAIYSGLSGPLINISNTVPAASWTLDTACQSRSACFAGDYRYGTFAQKTADGVLTFFTPWSGQAAGTTPPVGIFPQAATIDIVP